MQIAVVGSYGVGLTMQMNRMPLAGETLIGGPFREDHGGKGSNQAVGAARLGADVALLTAIGNDPYGRGARELWGSEGLDHASVMVSADAATMIGLILLEPSGENRIVIAPGALDELDEAAVESFREKIAAADLAVISMEIPLRAVLAALRVANEVGTPALLNPAPAQPLPEAAWPLIAVITPNQTEAAILLGRDPSENHDEQELASTIAALTSGTVVLTMGSAGALIADADGVRKVPAVAAKRVVDTTGAGDSFTAALAVSIAEGEPIEAAAAFAARAGAHAVGIAGVIPALPTRADLQ